MSRKTKKPIFQKLRGLLEVDFSSKIAIPRVPRRVSMDFFYVLVASLSLGIGILFVLSAREVSREADLASDLLPKGDAETALERRIRTIVKGHPIEKMAPYIAQHDELTASLIVGVAKKESNWGKRVPKLDGRDCFNYWGYRGGGDRVTWDGYTCFESPREAVRVVGRRMNELAVDHKLDTPKKFVVWKCGWTCAGHSETGVEKWIRDVSYYAKKVRPE